MMLFVPDVWERSIIDVSRLQYGWRIEIKTRDGKTWFAGQSIAGLMSSPEKARLFAGFDDAAMRAADIAACYPVESDIEKAVIEVRIIAEKRDADDV